MTTESLDNLTAPQRVSTAPWCQAAVQAIKPTLSMLANGAGLKEKQKKFTSDY